MKKNFLLIFEYLISSSVYASVIYDNNRLSLSFDGEFAGAILYNDTMNRKSDYLDITAYGELSINPDFQIDFNNKIGAFIQLKTYPKNEKNKKDKIYKEVYLYSEGNYGRFEIGREENISKKIHISTPDVGILNINNSDYLDTIILPKYSDFIYINSTAINTDKESNKINYISPSFYGLQIAGSYIPESNSGIYPNYKKGFTTSIKYSYEDSINFAITLGYGRFDETNFNLSKAKKRTEYSIGTKYYIRGFQFTASYKNILENNIINTISQNGYALNYGIAYEIGPFNISFSHHQSVADGLLSIEEKDKLYLSLISTKYSLNNNCDYSVSIGRIQYNPEDALSFIGTLITTGFIVNF